MIWTRTTLANLMGDCVVYRNLEPMCAGVEPLCAAWRAVGLDHYYIPRKTAPEYAATLFHYLGQIQRNRGISAPLERLLFIGDTLMNDGTAALNIARYLPLRGFIGADRLNQPAKVEWQGALMLANRWTALDDFVAQLRQDGFACDERTALLIDFDKTIIGARGRNDKPIDNARVQAILGTMRAALEGELDEAAFLAVYNPLNQPEYHPFTADNQDYLAYICLMAVGGVYPPEELWRDLKAGTLTRIEEFVARCEARRAKMPVGLRAAHDEVRRGMEAEDPTPFKAFRRREYLETVARMDCLPEDTAPEALLAQEITITAEVASVAHRMAEQGVLVFGISDKPDEASLPLPDDAARGYQPLHRTLMKLYGETLL